MMLTLKSSPDCPSYPAPLAFIRNDDIDLSAQTRYSGSQSILTASGRHAIAESSRGLPPCPIFFPARIFDRVLMPAASCRGSRTRSGPRTKIGLFDQVSDVVATTGVLDGLMLRGTPLCRPSRALLE
jgi:hypothetical protein